MDNYNTCIEIPSNEGLYPVEFKVTYNKESSLCEVSYDKDDVKIDVQCDVERLEGVFNELIGEFKLGVTAREGFYPVEFKVTYIKNFALCDVSYDKDDVKIDVQCDVGRLEGVFNELIEEFKLGVTE